MKHSCLKFITILIKHSCLQTDNNNKEQTENINRKAVFGVNSKKHRSKGDIVSLGSGLSLLQLTRFSFWTGDDTGVDIWYNNDNKPVKVFTDCFKRLLNRMKIANWTEAVKRNKDLSNLYSVNCTVYDDSSCCQMIVSSDFTVRNGTAEDWCLSEQRNGCVDLSAVITADI